MKKIARVYWWAFFLIVIGPVLLQAQPVKGLEPKKLDKSQSLQIGSFQINDGAGATAVKQVILNSTVQGPVQEFRASEKPDFAGAAWKSYHPGPGFTLSEGSGKKVVYFQVRNQNIGLMSVIKQDDIELKLPAPSPMPVEGKKSPVAPTAVPATDQYKMAGQPKSKTPGTVISRPGLLILSGFSINSNDAETLSREVQLFSTVRGIAQEYRAGERPDLWDGDWKPYANPATYPIRSAGYGMKTVYFQVRNPTTNQYSEIVSDTIKLVDPQAPRVVDGGMVGQLESGRPFDPRIESLDVAIARASGGNFLQLSYEVILNPVHCPGCRVEIAIIPIYGLFVEGQENAPLERTEGEYKDPVTGLYKKGGIFRRQFSDGEIWGPTGGLQTLIVRARVILPSGMRDDNTGNNIREKRVAFNRVKHKVSEQVINACKLGFGDDGNIGMRLDSQVSLPRHYWIGPSYLELIFCGTTKAGEDQIQCDEAPNIPGVGGRGLGWVARPTSDNHQITVHWWCETGGNPDLVQPTTGEGVSKFRFIIWTEIAGMAVTE